MKDVGEASHKYTIRFMNHIFLGHSKAVVLVQDNGSNIDRFLSVQGVEGSVQGYWKVFEGRYGRMREAKTWLTENSKGM